MMGLEILRGTKPSDWEVIFTLVRHDDLPQFKRHACFGSGKQVTEILPKLNVETTGT